MDEGELFARRVEASPMSLVLGGPGGSINMVNAKAERMFGYRRAELIGQKLEVLMPERFRAGHVGMREDFQTYARPQIMGRAGSS